MVSVSQDSSSAGFSGDTVLLGPGGRRDSQASARSIWRSQESGARSQESGARSQESLDETRRLGVPGIWQSHDSGARSQDSGDGGRQRDVTSGWARARARARARDASYSPYRRKSRDARDTSPYARDTSPYTRDTSPYARDTSPYARDTRRNSTRDTASPYCRRASQDASPRGLERAPSARRAQWAAGARRANTLYAKRSNTHLSVEEPFPLLRSTQQRTSFSVPSIR